MVNQPASNRKNSKCRLQFLTPHAWVVVLEEATRTVERPSDPPERRATPAGSRQVQQQ